MYCTMLFHMTITDAFSLAGVFMSMNRREALYLAASPILLRPAQLLPQQHISIIGGNGGTGRECARLLAEQGKIVKAISRNNVVLEDDALNKYIESVQMDIKDKGNLQALNNAIKGSSAVFFLANAKRKMRYIKSDVDEFQNYEDIDVFAMKGVVDACIKHRVPHLIYVSAACKSCLLEETTDYDKISGIECDNCRSKQMGENIIRKAYNSHTADGLAYTIVRIGFLINGENRGAQELELNQDYTKSGMISRTDLANVCIASAGHPKVARTTFEAYYRDTTQPYDVKESLTKCKNLGKSVEECFFGSEYKDKKPKSLEDVRKRAVKGSLFTTGEEHSGSTWDQLFEHLKKDNQYTN